MGTEGFNLVDFGVLALIVVSGLLAYSRGLIREALAIGGWLIAAVVAFLFAGSAVPLITEIPFIGEQVSQSCELGLIVGFVIVFTIALVLMSIITPLFAGAVQDSALGGIDRGFGFLFGALRGILLVVVALFLYQVLGSGSSIPIIDQSRSAAVLNDIASSIQDQGSERALSWITDRYETLVSSCGA